jgi:hypothetical protein
MNRKRAGRPSRELQPGERVPMSFRVTPELKAKMDAAAEESGRSVTQEIEFRLEQSFRDDRIEAQLEEIKLLLSANKPQA